MAQYRQKAADTSDEIPPWVSRVKPTVDMLYGELVNFCAVALDDMPLWYRVYDDFEIRGDTPGRVATPERFEDFRALICGFGHREALEAKFGTGTFEELLAERLERYAEYVEACRANGWRAPVPRLRLDADGRIVDAPANAATFYRWAK